MAKKLSFLVWLPATFKTDFMLFDPQEALIILIELSTGLKMGQILSLNGWRLKLPPIHKIQKIWEIWHRCISSLHLYEGMVGIFTFDTYTVTVYMYHITAKHINW